MNIDTAGIEAIVKRVMSSIDEANGVAPAPQGAKGKDGIFEDMEDAIAAAQAAWNDYKMRPLSLRYKIIDEIRKTLLLAVPAFVPASLTILIKVSGVAANNSVVVRLLIIFSFFFGAYRLNSSWLIFTAIVFRIRKGGFRRFYPYFTS